MSDEHIEHVAGSNGRPVRRRRTPVSKTGFRLTLFVIALVVLALGAWFAEPLRPYLAEDHLVFNSGQRIVVHGDQLCFTANAYLRPQPTFGKDRWNRRGYLVEVTLPSAETKSDPVRIVGPVWTGTEPEVVRFASPWQRTEGSTEFVFSPDGLLVKSRMAAGEQMNRWHLEVGDKQAQWVGEKELPAIDADYTSKSGGVFVSRSGSVLVAVSNKGEAICYDLATNTQRDDPWLSGAAHDAWERNAPGRLGQTILTDDLDYVVSFSADDSGEFAVGEEKYSRRMHGLVYHRGEPEPKIMTKAATRMSGLVPEYLSRDGELLLLDATDETLELRNCLTKEVKVHRFDDKVNWLSALGASVASEASGDRIVIVRLPSSLTAQRGARDEPLQLLVWHYKTDEVQEVSIPAQDWFKTELGGYYPETVIPVKGNAGQ